MTAQHEVPYPPLPNTGLPTPPMPSMPDAGIYVRQYLAKLASALSAVNCQAVEAAAAAIAKQLTAGGRLYAIGNGGSAATAAHFAEDLLKLGDWPAQAICEPALLLAWGNDTSFEQVFSEPLRRLRRPGDVLVAFSVSGTSPNVVRAVRESNEDMLTIAISAGTGGILATLADLTLLSPAADMQRAEDVHLALAHILCLRVNAHG